MTRTALCLGVALLGGGALLVAAEQGGDEAGQPTPAIESAVEGARRAVQAAARNGAAEPAPQQIPPYLDKFIGSYDKLLVPVHNLCILLATACVIVIRRRVLPQVDQHENSVLATWLLFLAFALSSISIGLNVTTHGVIAGFYSDMYKNTAAANCTMAAAADYFDKCKRPAVMKLAWSTLGTATLAAICLGVWVLCQLKRPASTH